MDPAVRAAQAEVIAAPKDTIFALASGRPPAAIAIVRISGPAAWGVVEALAGRLPRPREAAVRMLRDPGDGTVLDTALVLLFPAGASSTGDQVAELHLHGGRAVVDAVLACLSRQPGLIAAQAGAFTWRAFDNGLLDLTQVEGLGDLLSAETEGQRQAAVASASGGLSDKIASWRARLLDALGGIEAELDFADEDDVKTASSVVPFEAIQAEMTDLLARPSAERLRGEIEVVIAGPPNAGKSTLLNALVGREAAIVTEVAGTTRDLVSVPVTIGGAAMKLVDTAGLRDSDDVVERIGIGRALSAADAADLLLWVDDEAPPSEMSGNVLHVYPKIDLDGRQPPVGAVGVSAKLGVGIVELAEAISQRCAVDVLKEDPIHLNRRQRDLVSEAASELLRLIDADDPLIQAEHGRRAVAALDRLTGAAYVDDLLGTIFSRFCIGK